MTTDNMNMVLKVPVFSGLANLAFALRRDVFVIEQGVPKEEEFDYKDLAASHFVLVENGDVVATLRIIWHPDFAQISRFVVQKSSRGKGLGTRLITHAIDVIRMAGMDKIYLEAQSDKISFYERFGFLAFGEEFMDGGIKHRKMRNYTGAS